MADASTLTDSQRQTLSRVQRNMMLYIIVGQLFVQIDRTNIGFAQLTMSKELAISATVFGFASGLFALGAFAAQIPASLAFERFGARRWLSFIMVSWGLVVMAQAFVADRNALIALRFLLGALEAGYVPGVYVLVSQWFRSDSHGRLIAGLQIGAASSGILGAPFAGWILDHSLLGLSGWRSLFLLEGALTVLWAIGALRLIHDSPATTRWLKPEEREFMTRYLHDYQEQKMASGAVEKAGFWDALKDYRVVALMLAYVFAGWVTATVAFFMPTLIKTASGAVDNQSVGYMVMVPYIVMAIVSFTWGRHADRTERHWHCVLPLLVGAAGFLLYPSATTAGMAMLSMAMVQAGNTGFFVNFWPTCHMIVGKKTIAKTTAMINASNQVGNFCAPIFFGWALDTTGSSSLGLYVCVGALLTNFVVMNAFFFRYKAQQRNRAA